METDKILTAQSLQEQLAKLSLEAYQLARDCKKERQADKIYADYLDIVNIDINDENARAVIFAKFPKKIREYQRAIAQRSFAGRELSF